MSFFIISIILYNLVRLLNGSDIHCISLMSTEKANTSAEIIHCSNFSLHLLDNATICFPLQESQQVVNWNSAIIDTKLGEYNFSERSLFFGSWSVDAHQYGVNSADSLTTSTSLHDSSKLMTGAILEFVKYAKWQRVAMVTDAVDSFFLHTAEQFYFNFVSDFNVYFIQLFNFERNVVQSLKKLQRLRYRVIIVLLPKNLLKVVMCKRLQLGMTWPDYVWLVPNFDTKFAPTCKKGVIVFQHHTLQVPSDRIIPASFDKLVDISAGNRDASQSCYQLDGKKGYVIIYIWNDEMEYVSNYSVSAGLSVVVLNQIPPDIRLESFLALITIEAVLFPLILVFISVMLTLYIYFRKEPDIKATAVPLNLLTFVGCYLKLGIFVLGFIRSSVPRNLSSNHLAILVCKGFNWFSGVTVPGVLILSVLLMKLVRVYRLFHNFQVVKIWRWHDATLALYALLLTTPSVVISIFQTVFAKVEVIAYTDSHQQFKAYRVCTLHEVYSIHALYVIFICILLFIMALKTCNIKDPRFKDAKNVIVLVVLLVLKILLLVVYNGIFGSTPENIILANTILLLCHTFGILECQLLLFGPKLYKVLKNKTRRMK